MLFEKYLGVIDQKAELICHVSDTIWENPETCFGEFIASKLLADTLEAPVLAFSQNMTAWMA